MKFFFAVLCCFIFSKPVFSQQEYGREGFQDADIQINDNSSISTDPRPFKRRAPQKKAPIDEEITSAEQMRQMLGSPHEMSEESLSRTMPRGFSVSNSQESFSSPQRPSVVSAFPSRPKRGGAGGVSRPALSSATSSLARRKIQETRDRREAERKANPTPKEKFVQEGLKMFDEKTAKEVMNIQPNTKELEKLSPEERQRVLDTIEVKKSKPTQPAGETQKKKYGGGFRNIKDSPY